jgi:hypothetical protein
MTDRRGNCSLPLELRDELRVGAVLAAEKLQRDKAAEVRIKRAIDRSHPSSAEDFLQLEVIEIRANPLAGAAGRAVDKSQRFLLRHVDEGTARMAGVDDRLCGISHWG